MTYIISFVSQKGGVGKSTKVRALARETSHGGLKTKIADLDIEQATSAEWHRRRLANGLAPAASVESYSTAQQALDGAENFEVLIIDGPARASKGTLEIAKVSDLIVQPTGASLDDLVPAVKVFHALVKAGISKQRLVFSLNHIGTENEENAAREYIREAGYEVLAGCLMERPAYRQAQNDGFW